MVFIKLNNMENWKDIPTFENEYMVSDLGNVKSTRFNKEKILKQGIQTQGYCIVDLKGNSITNVKVEYEDYWIKAEYSLDVAYRPVINSNCTINIKPIKDSWSREEVESLIREWASFTVTGRGQWWKPNDLDNWIKENL